MVLSARRGASSPWTKRSRAKSKVWVWPAKRGGVFTNAFRTPKITLTEKAKSSANKIGPMARKSRELQEKTAHVSEVLNVLKVWIYISEVPHDSWREASQIGRIPLPKSVPVLDFCTEPYPAFFRIV